MIDSQGRFHGTDWLKLETAIEIIGDMIAYYSSLKAIPGVTSDEINEFNNKIIALGKERQGCYDISINDKIIIKAYTEYGPFLKSKMNDPIYS